MAITNSMVTGGYYAGGGGGGNGIGAGAIGGPVAGQMRINSVTGGAEAWTGHTWVPVNHTSPSPTDEDLKDSAWVPTISQLLDLWTVKFGTGWVGESEVADDFYRVAKTRLVGVNKLEKVQGRHATVYRIVE
jgi:hypothetical protein